MLWQEFFDTFKEGFDLYLEGNWQGARAKFDKVEDIKGMVDYPTRNLLDILAETNYQAPRDWAGYRILTEKWGNLLYIIRLTAIKSINIS